jgi:hypothetical protein
MKTALLAIAATAAIALSTPVFADSHASGSTSLVSVEDVQWQELVEGGATHA